MLALTLLPAPHALALGGGVWLAPTRGSAPHPPRSSRLARMSQDDELERSRLEHLFTLRAPQPIHPPPDEPSQPQPGFLDDVPLFRPGWTALPGFTHTIRVDAPHYVHMFEQLTAAAAKAGERAVFGHLKLANASRSVGRPDSGLVAGSRSPKVGVVMEVVSIERLADGALTIVAHGTSRFCALRPRASTSFSRADLMLLPDLEEISEVRDWPDTVQLPAELRAEATRAAAAAVSYMWAQAELGQQLLETSGSDASRSDATRAGEPRMQGAERGAADEVERGSDGLSPFNLRLSIPCIKREAHAIATAAAEAVVLQAMVEQRASRLERDTDEILGSLFKTQVDGVQRTTRGQIMKVPRALFSTHGPPAGRAFLLALEQALWTELVSCLQLSRGNTDGIPEPLLLLVPPAPAHGWSVPMPHSSASEWLRRWDYPPVRRAQRLSFLMATMLPQLERQRLLEAASVRERLQLGVVYLGEMRRRLVASRLIHTVPGLEGRGDSFGI
ncbi:hypothetical protein AB1Y20_016397 [Prymnesium parvum]|uniref:Lon N-terminal domain-containing protein n=1 Tax=Prymnesium parvum TaxID=97485 RepID=A0AB34IDV7_PRYPA